VWVEGKGELPGQLVVVSGPSGCGKSSIIRAALLDSDLNATLSVSATTRGPRPGEHHGVDYFFKTQPEFLADEMDSRFLESAIYNGNRYGTPAAPVFESLSLGKTVLLEIEVQGALQVRRTAPTALFVFIKTPTFRDLERRLRGRGTESESIVHNRLLKARDELAEAHWYDVQLINDVFDECVASFITLLKTYGRGGN
jgi:guanylate kinase